MKTLFVTIGIIAMLSSSLKSQIFSNDTLVCIIDTTKCYVKFTKNPCANGDPECRWQISIKGHYFDVSQPSYKDFACTVFNADNLHSLYRNFKGPYQIKTLKGIIKDRYIVVTDEWINKQAELQTLINRMGRLPSTNYNFIVFKQDFDNAKADSVIMHRVSLGYSEVVE